MRPKPILSLTLLAAALAHSGVAAPLGLGKLTVLSSLGQPLSAQIEVTSLSKEELDSMSRESPIHRCIDKTTFRIKAR
jgi:Tfp pilus assembly protein FimV